MNGVGGGGGRGVKKFRGRYAVREIDRQEGSREIYKNRRVGFNDVISDNGCS